jgi:hypothetical protein
LRRGRGGGDRRRWGWRGSRGRRPRWLRDDRSSCGRNGR